MNMMDPDHELFTTIVDEGGLAAAGRRLHISPAMMSKRLARLEERDRIGRDLHDGVIQSIYAAGLGLESVRGQLRHDPELAEKRDEADALLAQARAAIVDLKPAYGRAVVRVPGFAFSIPTARLEDVKGQSPALADLFARYADVLLAQMMQSTACNALHGVEQRYCRWLLSTHDRAGDEPIRLTQETLAQMMGVQRTTVTAVARALQDDGVIATGRGRIEILDRSALERRACECHDAVEHHFQRLLPEIAVND